MVMTYSSDKLKTVVEWMGMLESRESIENAGFDVVRIGFDGTRLVALGKSPNSGRGVVGKGLYPDGNEWHWNGGDYKDDFEDAKSIYDHMVLYDVWIASTGGVE